LNPLKRLAGQTAIYGVSSIVARLLNYFLVPLHVRIFLPDEYGIVGQMYAYISLLAVILTFGMETAFFRYYTTESNKKKLFFTSLFSLTITSLVFIILTYLFIKPVTSLIQISGHNDIIYWCAIIVAIDAITTIPFAKLRAENKAKKFALIKFMNILVNVVFNLFFLLLCPWMLKNGYMTSLVEIVYNENVGVGYIFISNLIASAFTILLLLPDILKTEYKFDMGLFRNMFRYALPLLVYGLAGIINETMDRIFLAYLSPADIAMRQVGIYSACYKITLLMTILIQAFKYAAEPFFFSQAKETNAKQVYADVMNYFIIACSVIFLGIMLYIDIVKYFVDKPYYEGLKIVPILLLANMFLGIFYNLSIWYKLTNQTKWGAYISVLGAIITIILNILLIPVLGYMGSAWATLACYASMMVISYLIGQRKYHIQYKLRNFFFYTAGALMFYLISVYFKPEKQAVRLLFNTLLFGGYLILLYLYEFKFKFRMKENSSQNEKLN
jgi:O-antigen/teichoic acid export membrane protein